MACSNIAMVKNVSSSQDNKLDRSSCILHSYLEGNNNFGQNSVTEYGWLGKGSSIGNNSIVSNVIVSDGLALPDDVFMHTVCVKAENGERGQFVTVTFGIKDNLKKTCSDARSSSELKLHYRSLDKAMELLGYPKVNIFVLFWPPQFWGPVFSRCRKFGPFLERWSSVAIVS